MRHRTKLALAGLTATLAMALALTSTAPARTFSFSNWSFRVVWTSVEFINTMGFGTVRCPLTLEGSFHSQTISKVENALIGQVSRATIAEASCTGGRATVHQESLPWHVTYSGFRGILPRINSIRVSLSRPTFEIQTALAGTCTVIADTEHQSRGEVIINEREEITNDVPDEAPNIPTNAGCPVSSGRFRGGASDGRVTLLGNTTRIRVTLI